MILCGSPHLRFNAYVSGQLPRGCMVGSSLAIAPAVLLAQGAEVVDLDAPLLLAEDRAAPLRYDERGVWPPEPGLWG